MAARWLAAPPEVLAPRLAVVVFLGLPAFPSWAVITGPGSPRYLCYGLFAMSLSLVWGRGGILCRQAIFFGMGGYAMAALTKHMGPDWLAGSLPARHRGPPAGAGGSHRLFPFWGGALAAPISPSSPGALHHRRAPHE